MTVNYGYNSVGALSGVGTSLIAGDQWTNIANTLLFRGTGAIKSMNYGNGRRLQMSYDANRQQPAGMKVDRQDGSDTIIDNAYQYYDSQGRNNGRIRQITDNYDPGYTTQYYYDDYNRLTGAYAGPIPNWTWSRSYAHDPWGNITNLAGVTQNYATNTSGAPATNRVIGDSTGAAFGYDQAGNMTSAPGWSYAYDGANRLNQASGPSGTSTYAFDGDGMRVKQTSNGGSPLLYVRSSVLKQAVLEVNSTQGVYRAYIYAGGKLLAERTPDGNLYWLHTNHLGNSSRMTDQNGTMVYRGEFDPYGNLVYEWGTAGLNTRKFTGYERDSNTGLDYANARMYGAGRGRFIQPDIKGLGSADVRNPQTLNRYAYVNNDPVNFIDPGGMLALIPKFDLCSLGFQGYCISDNVSGGGYFDGNFLPEEEGVDGGLGGDDGVSGNSGKMVLFGQQLVDFNEARNKAIKLLGDPESDCAKFLKSHGLNPVELATSLSALIPYDALQSTNIDSFGVFVGRVKDIFKQIAISSGSCRMCV